MTTPGTTTIRVSVETRDRLNELIRRDLPGKTVDDAIGYLLDEDWKRGCIADLDRLRETDPDSYADYIRESDRLDRDWSAKLDKDAA